MTGSKKPRQPHRPDAAEKLRARVNELEAEQRTLATDRDRWKMEAEALTATVASMHDEAEEQDKQLRKLQSEIDVLNVEIAAMAKVEAMWEARADAETARAARTTAVAKHGIGGSDVRQILARD